MNVKEYIPNNCSSWYGYYEKMAQRKQSIEDVKNTLGALVVLVGILFAYVACAYIETMA